ncbi:hypothetical protein EM308_15110 [Flavobacterium gilvum]|uniref:Uncharacterized protein n=1 Tax=Flavobacterium gilvum TaxID=1492737 RepID=A0AAC9I7H0_9FLAO|nr:hypothetical protein EM308_15110 [Flavobacterium gilvum]
MTLAKTQRRKEIGSKLCASATLREKTNLSAMTLSSREDAKKSVLNFAPLRLCEKEQSVTE